ncbi:MAG: polysaccharide deacetylase family protein [Candidatus Omnitrophica bacterium]|nr:polysaccharide deacetylase family protein [Candidatus Omnitrophota bacterium]
MRSPALKTAAVLGVAALLYAWVASARETPVLMYHRISSSESPSSLHVLPEDFEKQMEFLKVHRYRVVPLAELAGRILEKKPVPPKTVAITFDDGSLDNFQNAFPVLKNMGFPATIFMITENIGKEGWLSEEDLRILDESGIAIGSHTVTHAFLPELGTEKVAEELARSKKDLEKVLGHPVTLLSYPGGGVTRSVIEEAGKAGYQAAVTTNYGREKDNAYAMRRVKVSGKNGNLFRFWPKVSGYSQLGKKRIEIK